MAARAKDAVTVRLDEQKRAELDTLAWLTARDRSFPINEATDSCLAVHRWQIARIADGLHQAKAGDFASPEEVEFADARWA